MPQMMPMSWLVIFVSSVFLFMLLNSGWSTFFFLLSFPKKSTSSIKKKTFWFNN